MIFTNPPTHSHAYPNVIKTQLFIIIAYFRKMGSWEVRLKLTYARVFKHFKFFARMINRIIFPYSQIKEKELRFWEVAFLDCLLRVWECVGGSNA